MRTSKSGKIAFCGISGAIILLLMLLGNIIPIATYAVPCLAAILMMIVMYECGEKNAWLLYIAVSLLSLILISDKELMMLYILLMGFYPMVKCHIDRLNRRIFRIIIKLLLFNTAISAIYFILLIVFPVNEIAAEFAAAGTIINALMILIGNVIFFMLDIVLNKMHFIYVKKLRPKLIKSSRS